MDRHTLLAQGKRLLGTAEGLKGNCDSGLYSMALEFLVTFAGPTNSFVKTLEDFNPASYVRRNGEATTAGHHIYSILRSFMAYVESGLFQEVSPERRAQLDVVSDFLEQALALLDDSKVHPVAPAILIGAALEEFLRTWAEFRKLPLGAQSRGINTYAQVLSAAGLITKQDVKDITSWAGLRNMATHGDFDAVKDPARIRLMLEAVNFFMARHKPIAQSTPSQPSP